MSRQPMNRGKLLLLTLGISSGIHLALAAAYLWLDNSAGTRPARAVVEISLQQPAAVKSTQPAQQPPEHQPVQLPDEKLLSSQRENTAQQPVVDNESPPEPTPTRQVEAESPPEMVAEATTLARPTEDTGEETISEPPDRAGAQTAEHSAALEAEKQNYLGLVAEHINSYKYYPRSAIRRGTEGQVEVSFDLQPDGSIENLRTRGEHSVLTGASQRSIEQALPMPQRSENLLALGSIHIEFSMKYFLHEQ